MTVQPTARQLEQLDVHINFMEASVKSKPEEQKFHAALGALYMRRNNESQNDLTNAAECFRKTIELAPDHKDSALAYANRGKLYIIQDLYDKAMEDLTKAKEFFGQISPQMQATIEADLNRVQQLIRKRKVQTSGTLSMIPHLKAGGANKPVAAPSEQFYKLLGDDEHLKNVSSQTVLFFGQILLSLNKKMDSQINSMPNDNSQTYWKALALCTKALNQEKEFGMTDHIRGLYFQAKELFVELLGRYHDAKKSPLSIVHYAAATVYFKLDLLEESLEQLNKAILLNPDGDATYYKFRSLLHEQLGNADAAKADEKKALEIDPNPPYHSIVRSLFNEVNHCIEFYDQVILDDTNYYIPDSIFESLADTGVNFVPKRGKDLDSLEILYAKRAMLNAILGRCEPEKLSASITDSEVALSKLSIENPLYLKVLLSRVQVHFYMKNYDAALVDLNEAIKRVTDRAEIYMQRAALYYATENYEASLADLEIASSLTPNDPVELKEIKQFVAKKLAEKKT